MPRTLKATHSSVSPSQLCNVPYKEPTGPLLQGLVEGTLARRESAAARAASRPGGPGEGLGTAQVHGPPGGAMGPGISAGQGAGAGVVQQPPCSAASLAAMMSHEPPATWSKAPSNLSADQLKWWKDVERQTEEVACCQRGTPAYDEAFYGRQARYQLMASSHGCNEVFVRVPSMRVCQVFTGASLQPHHV
jgi:hypothetical protein